MAFIACSVASTRAGAEALERLTDFHSRNIYNDPGSNPRLLGAVANGIVFTADVPGLGTELWSALGDPVHTQLVFDACPGRIGVRIVPVGQVLGRQILLVGESCDYQYFGYLYSTSGVPGDLTKIYPSEKLSMQEFDVADLGVPDSHHLIVRNFRTSQSDQVILATDGSLAGTVVIRTSDVSEIPTATVGALDFFSTFDEVAGDRLWKTNGTPSGTQAVASIAPEQIESLWPSQGHLLYFAASSEGKHALWRSDGTSAGTFPIGQFPGAQANILHLETFQDTAFLLVRDSSTGTELWRSNGTSTGTQSMTDFGPENPFWFDEGRPEAGLAVGSFGAIIAAYDGIAASRLWRAPLAGSGASPFADACSGSISCYFDGHLVNAGDRVIYFSNAGTQGQEPWTTDGTVEGTGLLVDSCPGPCSGQPNLLTTGGSRVLFAAGGGDGAVGAWTTDGTTDGTVRIGEGLGFSPQPTADSYGPWALPLANAAFYSGEDSRGSLLWYANEPTWIPLLIGPLDGTVEIGPGPSAILPQGNSLVFAAFENYIASFHRMDEGTGVITRLDGAPSACQAPYRIYGRAGETILLSPCFSSDLWALPAGSQDVEQLSTELSSVERSASSSELAFLVATPNFPEYSRSLWVSDGTAAGTEPTHTFPQENGVASLAALGNQLLLNVGESIGTNLFRASSPYTTLTRLTNFHEGFAGVASPIVPAGSTLFFLVIDSGTRSIWRTDGSIAGTIPLFEDPTVEGIAWAAERSDGYLFLVRKSGSSTLWASDGTPGGTSPVKNLPWGGVTVDEPLKTVNVGGTTFFPLQSEEGAWELFRSDGTEVGTEFVAQLTVGDSSWHEFTLLGAGDELFFSGNGSLGQELWKVEQDSTVRLVQDIRPGPSPSSPRELTRVNDSLYFSADDGLHGSELWKLDLNDESVCRVGSSTLCLEGGRFQVQASWRDFSGTSGEATAVQLTPETGYFWFFDDQNVEMILKVLDGTGTNEHHWVYYGALSNVEYSLTVTDGVTGAAKRYFNPAARFASTGDIYAFGPLGAHPQELQNGLHSLAGLDVAPLSGIGVASASGNCIPAPTRFCILDGRFAVEATWRDFSGNSGTAYASTLTNDTGYLWFFDESNVEVVLKAIDGSGSNGHYWIYYGALSNVEYTITVTDTVAQTSRQYHNLLGSFGSFGDIEAFPAP
mgnify:CR=1 FL=1